MGHRKRVALWNTLNLHVIENSCNKELADISKWSKVNKSSLIIKKDSLHYIFSKNKAINWIYE